MAKKNCSPEFNNTWGIALRQDTFAGTWLTNAHSRGLEGLRDKGLLKEEDIQIQGVSAGEIAVMEKFAQEYPDQVTRDRLIALLGRKVD